MSRNAGGAAVLEAPAELVDRSGRYRDLVLQLAQPLGPDVDVLALFGGLVVATRGETITTSSLMRRARPK